MMYMLKLEIETVISREIPVQKGLKQGDCISCELYPFISQVFLLPFKNLHNLKPLKMGHVLSLLHLFADDTCIFLKYDRGGILSLEKLFDQNKLELA